MLNLRVISGSVDGKIRIWHQLTGVCLRIMRGNAAMDPISSLHFSDSNFLLVNTITSMCMFAFEMADDKAVQADLDLVGSPIKKPLKMLSNAARMTSTPPSSEPLLNIAQLSLDAEQTAHNSSSNRVRMKHAFSGSWRTAQVTYNTAVSF